MGDGSRVAIKLPVKSWVRIIGVALKSRQRSNGSLLRSPPTIAMMPVIASGSAAGTTTPEDSSRRLVARPMMGISGYR